MNLVCRFPGEECDLRAIGYAVMENGTRIPVCEPHIEKVKAHLVAMRLGVTMPNGPSHPRVMEARAMLNAHTMPCATCRPVVDELSRRMAAINDTPTVDDQAAFGLYITSNSCKIGVRLYHRLGLAMLAIRETVES